MFSGTGLRSQWKPTPNGFQQAKRTLGRHAKPHDANSTCVQLPSFSHLIAGQGPRKSRGTSPNVRRRSVAHVLVSAVVLGSSVPLGSHGDRRRLCITQQDRKQNQSIEVKGTPRPTCATPKTGYSANERKCCPQTRRLKIISVACSFNIVDRCGQNTSQGK